MTTTSTALDRSKAELEQEIGDLLRDGETSEATGVSLVAAAASPRRRVRPGRPGRPKRSTKKKATAGARKRVRAKAKAKLSKAGKKMTKKKAASRKKIKPAARRAAKKVKKVKKKSTKRASAKRASRPRKTSGGAVAKVGSTTRASIAATPLTVVLGTVGKMPAAGRFGPEKVFIYPLWQKVGEKIGMSLAEFKRWLLAKNRERHLDLARADLVGAMDPDLVRESEIRDLGSSFHFVLDPAGRGTW